VVLVIMGTRCLCLVTVLVLGLLEASDPGPQHQWSSLGFMSSQASKRSAEDSNETAGDDMDLSASDTQYDVMTYNDLSSSSNMESRVAPNRRRRKYRTRRRKNRYEPKPYDPLVVPSQDFNAAATIPDNQLYDRDSSYDPPSSSYNSPADSYSPPSSSYEAPSYYDTPSYKPSGYEAYSGGGKDSFNDFLNALAAFLPIGLFLAAIPPNLIVINSRRKRDVDEQDDNSVETIYPFLEKINKIGWGNLNEVSCQKELFCEMAVMGGSSDGNYVQRSLAALVQYTPTFLAQRIGVEDVVQATSSEKCQQFKCLQ